MGKRIKKSYVIIDIILSIFIIFLMINIFFIRKCDYFFLIITTLIPFIILILRLGFEKKNKRFTYETMFYMFSYTVIYLIIIYLLGLYTGFNRRIYNLNLYNLISNIIPYFLVIVIGEYFRSEVVRKAENSTLSYILLSISMVLIDCIIYLKTFDLSISDNQIKFICYILLPSVSKNGLLLYISNIGGHYPCIIYRLIMELTIFIIPIEPNFGLYIESVVNTLLPAIIGFLTYYNLGKYRNKEILVKDYNKNGVYSYISIILTVILITSFVILSSCKFEYGLISIGSGSMTGTINKGDAVIYKSINKKTKIKKGDILIFSKEGRVIVHRIIRTVKTNEKEIVYYTKGDANKSEDGYPIQKKDIIGIAVKRIRYIGIPSVSLHELINHK